MTLGRNALTERYFTRLAELDSPLLADPTAVDQLRAQAHHIIDRIVALTCRSTDRRQERALSHTIGEHRALNRTDPGESWRAARMLFDTIAEMAFPLVPLGPDTAVMCSQLATIIHTAIAERMTEAWDAYTAVLLSQVSDAQNTERLRIARDLHDHVGHGLSASQRNLELQQIYRAAGDPREAEAGAVALQMVVEAMRSMHAVIDHMRTGNSVRSTQVALKELVESMQPIDVDVVVDVNGDDRWLPHHVTDESFLIVREALRNAITHAHARHITASVDIAPSRWHATVVDDGDGFDIAKLVQHTGISSMHERAAQIGGTVRVTSCPGTGTQVELLVFADAADAAEPDDRI